MEETFKTKGVCATTIQFTRDGDKIRNIRFTGKNPKSYPTK